MTAQRHFERLKEQLQKDIGEVVAHQLRDPRIPDVVTITNIKLAQDTRNATVFVSVYGDEPTKEKALTALNKAAPYIQHLVSQKINIKHFPRLCFKLDNSIEQGERIKELLKEVQGDLDRDIDNQENQEP